jgi:hypothetical protein
MEREVQWLCSGCEDLVCLFRKCSFGAVGWLRGKSTIGLWGEHTVEDPVNGSDILFHVHFFSSCSQFLGVDGRTSQIRHVSECCSSGTSNCVPHVSQIARLLGSKLIL